MEGLRIRHKNGHQAGFNGPAVVENGTKHSRQVEQELYVSRGDLWIYTTTTYTAVIDDLEIDTEFVVVKLRKPCWTTGGRLTVMFARLILQSTA